MKNYYSLFLVLLLTTTTFAQKIDSSAIGLWKVTIFDSSKSYNSWKKYSHKFPDNIKVTDNKILSSQFKSSDSLVNKISYKNSSSDSLNFDYQYRNKSKTIWAPQPWGKAKLLQINDTVFIGRYTFQMDKITNSVSMKLERIWCCGNHTPAHCNEELTKECKKIH